MVSISGTVTGYNKKHALAEYVEQHIWRLSKILWRWSESRLMVLVGVLAGMDYLSTLAFLQFSGDKNVYESGLLASRALQAGGYLALFIVDAAAIGILILTALGTRWLYLRKGLMETGRAAFIFLLVPYAVIAAAAVCNNIMIALL